MNKSSELRKLTVDELREKLLTLRKEQFNVRLQKAAGVLNKTDIIRKLRRSIAQVKTIIREMIGTGHVEK